jgi:uncharacterized protein (TIGR03067 family)
MNAETRRNGRFVGLAGAALVVFASLSLAGDAADEEATRLEGNWKFLSLSVDGEDAPQEFIQKGRWTIRGKEIIPGSAEGKISLKVDPAKSPKALDFTALDGPRKGKSLQCIYKLEGDRLTICVPEGKGESSDPKRPEEFRSGPGRSLLVLERSKDK